MPRQWALPALLGVLALAAAVAVVVLTAQQSQLRAEVALASGNGPLVSQLRALLAAKTAAAAPHVKRKFKPPMMRKPPAQRRPLWVIVQSDEPTAPPEALSAVPTPDVQPTRGILRCEQPREDLSGNQKVNRFLLIVRPLKTRVALTCGWLELTG